ncbi:MAG: hypothetical protein HY719_06770 [Planctomycetes bacterium]|nr:hypothetical protein [Planctomycetota bacterium]
MVTPTSLPAAIYRAENSQMFQNQALILDRNFRDTEAEGSARRIDESDKKVERGEKDDNRIDQDGSARNPAYFARRQKRQNADPENPPQPRPRDSSGGGLIDLVA